ncbi:MAG: hypothetical protein Q4G64_03205 [bacterium]|nr:hypothetical protein [bacterium]
MKRIMVTLAYLLAALLLTAITPRALELHGPFVTAGRDGYAVSDNLVVELTGSPAISRVAENSYGEVLEADDGAVFLAIPLRVTNVHTPDQFLNYYLEVGGARYGADMGLGTFTSSIFTTTQPRIWMQDTAGFVISREVFDDASRVTLFVQSGGGASPDFGEQVSFTLGHVGEVEVIRFERRTMGGTWDG